jgi:hypothetical protein
MGAAGLNGPLNRGLNRNCDAEGLKPAEKMEQKGENHADFPLQFHLFARVFAPFSCVLAPYTRQSSCITTALR